MSQVRILSPLLQLILLRPLYTLFLFYPRSLTLDTPELTLSVLNHQVLARTIPVGSKDGISHFQQSCNDMCLTPFTQLFFCWPQKTHYFHLTHLTCINHSILVQQRLSGKTVLATLYKSRGHSPVNHVLLPLMHEICDFHPLPCPLRTSRFLT